MKDIARSIEEYLEFYLHKKRWRDLTRLEKKLIVSHLETREEIFDKDFLWTEEAKAGILRLNTALFEADALVNEEYDKRKSELEAREKSEDKFLNGYNIDRKIGFMIETLDEEGEWEEPEDGIYDILNRYIDADNAGLSTIASMHDLGEEPLNWNNMIGTASEHFKDDFIHYGIHCLWHHTPLAWEDILKIRSLWTEVSVDYQRITDLF
jgi:hypothetical protein